LVGQGSGSALADRVSQAVAGRSNRPREEEISQIVTNMDRAAELRSRLSDIIWFMKSMNQWIARRGKLAKTLEESP